MRQHKFKLGEQVRFREKRAIIADRLNHKYALWDQTGQHELDVYSDYPDGWVPADQLTKGW